MRRLAVVALFAVACGAAPAHAQTLALAYHQGGIYKYNLHATSSEQINESIMVIPVKTDFTAVETATVKSVDSAGVADLTIALTKITLKSTYGTTTNTTTGMTLPALDITIAADGRVLSVNGMSTAGALGFGTGIGGNIVSAVLPDVPVKPGDTWSKNYDQANPMGTGAIHVTTTSKYLRDESFKGVNAAVIETKSNAAIDFTLDPSKLLPTSSGTSPIQVPTSGAGDVQGMTIKGTVSTDVTSWIDPSGHRIMKSHMTATTADNMSFGVTPGSAGSGSAISMAITGSETLDLTQA